MKTPTVIFVILAAFSASCAVQLSDATCSTRKSTGLTCDTSCSKLYYCFEGNGKWENVLIQECLESTFCDVFSGKCSSNPRSCNSHCSGRQTFDVLERKCVDQILTDTVICEAPGNVPDPDDCYWYYECDSNLEAVHKPCPSLFHFNTKYRFCRPGDCPYEC